MNCKKTSFLILILFATRTFSIAQTQISNFSPANIIGGIGEVLNISGSGFGNQQGNNYVAFMQESGSYLDATNARSLRYISWTDNKIQLEMPTAYSGPIMMNISGTKYTGADTLKVKANLNYRNAYPLDYTYLVNQNGKGGYTWYIHRTYWSNPEAKAAIEDVFKEFRCKTGVNFILASQPSDAKLTLNDTINLIAPDASLGSGGYQYLLWNSCILGSESFYFKKAMDIGLSDKESWDFDTGMVTNGKSKFRYVLMHELGHAVGLGHVDELGQTMYPTVTLLPSDDWCERDSITTEEQICMSYMVTISQNFSFRACGVSPLLKVFNCDDVYGIKASLPVISAIKNFSIYPIPSDDIFVIEWINASTKNIFIEVYDMMGKKIQEQTIPNNLLKAQIHLGSCPAGQYILKIHNGPNTQIEKLLKQ